MIFSTKILGIILSLLEAFNVDVTNLDFFINLDLGLAIVEFILIIVLLVCFFKKLSKICKNTSKIVELLEKQNTTVEVSEEVTETVNENKVVKETVSEEVTEEETTTEEVVEENNESEEK